MTPKQLSVPGEIVSRVAKKVDVDAAVVRSVANGTRRSALIEFALREEMISLRKTLTEFLMPSSASVLCGDKRRRE